MSQYDEEFMGLFDESDDDVGGDGPQEEESDVDETMPYISETLDISMVKGHKMLRTPEAIFEERAFGFLGGSAYEEKKNEIMNRIRRTHNFHLYKPELLIWATIFTMEKRKLEAKIVQSFISSKGVHAQPADLVRYIRLIGVK